MQGKHQKVISLTLTRHGQTVHNKEQMICGQLPGKLTDKGVKQAERIGLHFAKQSSHFDVAYVSDLGRTRETYSAILKTAPELQKVEVIYTDLIREKSAGELENKPLMTFKKIAEERKLDIRDYKPKNGESWKDVHQRAAKFLETLVTSHLIAKNNKDFKILGVSHGGFLMEFYNLVLQIMQKQQARYHNSAHNCSLHEFVISYPPKLEEYKADQVQIKCVMSNYTKHLE